MAGRIAALRDAFGGTATGWPSPDDGDVSARSGRVVAVPGEERSSLHPEWMHRALNVTVAATAMVLLAPCVLVIALLIKLTSPGPVFYTQTRVGLDRRAFRGDRQKTRREEDLGGRVFTIYKFRSMRVDAEVPGEAVWASKNDPRITAIGELLRKTRLDELPQLWNVVRGEMNVVGPRPERPSIFLSLRTQVENYHLRQRVKPGITGWAQINQAYDSSIEDVKNKVALDLEYIAGRSLWMDLRIMASTPFVMIGRKGAH
ncbi:MAG: sugar transferase [Gemmatimonadaceae bacterium]|nr:sugar transferase [Gemmatimonadaceae bacterium]